jgi:hypothetical protein
LRGVNADTKKKRAAARAGQLLIGNRYTGGEGEWERVVRLWRAAIAYPRLFTRYPANSFLPGGPRARAAASRLARRLGVR